MAKVNLRSFRRTSRLSISIPVVVSGVDADGNGFSESVRTQVINHHGGEIAMARHLAIGTEVLVKNPARGLAAKGSVVRLGEKVDGALHPVVLALLEAQEGWNVWGTTFPPDDWRPGLAG
jgi:hypothetical protein